MQTDFDRNHIEKIVTAIYFVTQVINGSDPLKWRLRDIGIEMLRASRIECVAHLLEIDQLLSVARVSGVISDMNAELIQTSIRGILKRHDSGLQLPTDFFETQELSESSVQSQVEDKKTIVPKNVVNKEDVAYKRHVVKATDTDKRRDGIVTFLRGNSPATTTDIKKIVRGVSEKTIQRDLKWLMKNGVVTREGTRRWATYSLSQ